LDAADEWIESRPWTTRMTTPRNQISHSAIFISLNKSAQQIQPVSFRLIKISSCSFSLITISM